MRQVLTQRQLAQQIGLSYPTVSRAFNGSPLVDERTRKRILAAAERLGYRKNLTARSLVMRKTNSIGVVITNSPHSFWSAVLEGIEAQARERHYHVLLSHSGTGDAPELEDDAITFLLDRQVDGLILVPSWKRQDFGIFRDLEKRRVPLLFVDSRLAGARAAFVGTDNIGGMKTACRHLIGLGHRRIAFVAGPEGHWNSDHRLAGYREAMQAAGLRIAPEWLFRADGFLVEHGRQAALALLAQRVRPTAVIAVNDPIAFGLEQTLLEQGVRVPADMALVGFSGETEGALLSVPLTTVAAPMAEMGRQASESLIARIAGKQIGMISQELPCKLIVRASCGAGQGRNGRGEETSKTRRAAMKRLMLAGLVAIMALTAGLAHAGNTYWMDNTGADWSTAGNWSTGAPPTAVDKAWVGHTTSGTNPASVTISADVTASELDVAYQSAINVTGTVTQTGGTATFGSGGVKLAGANGDGGKYPKARYFLNGGTFTNSGDLYIGGNQVYSDTAFVQTAGTATVNTVNMYAVTGSGRGASLVVSGGVFICRSTLWVGGQGVSSSYGGNLIIANDPTVQAKNVYCNANMTVPGSSSNFLVTTEFDLPYWASAGVTNITCTFYGVNTNVPWSLLTVAGTGHKAEGTFVIDGSQGGGLFQVQNINLARYVAGATGTVKVVNGGKLRAGVNSGGWSYAWCGDTSGTALIRLGDASSLGWIEWLPGNAVQFYLRNDASGSAELRGVGGFVTNATKRLNFYANGRIVADGWGAASDRDLDLSFTASLYNNIANGASESNGWYAVNRARLIMPPVTVATGSNNYNLGDEGSADNDLVNSVRCSFTGVTTGGVVTNTLLALDRSDVPASGKIKNTVSAHQVFSPAAMAFGGLTLTFRYDANACQAQGLTSPDVVQVYGGTAVKLPVTALDTTNKRISVTVSALHGTDTFLLGKAVSSGTVITIR